MMWLWRSIKSNKVLFIILLLYHLGFTLFNYYYRINRGIADAFSYWGLGRWDFSNTTYFDLWVPGNAFFVGLHFYLVQLSFPIWVGFAYYSIIGLIGCWIFYLWTTLVIHPKNSIQKVSVIFCAFLPSVHIWTSNLGKESVLFLCIAVIIYCLQQKKYVNFYTLICLFIIGMIRPHLFALLISALIIGYLIFSEFKLQTKFILLGLGSLLLIGSILTLQEIGYLPSITLKSLIEFQDIQYANYMNRGAYIDMKNLNILEKSFSFLFRPLDFTSTKLLIILSSFYNSFLMILFVTATIKFSIIRNSIKINPLYFSLLIFSITSAIAFTFIYGNMGLFMRTKVLCLPFLIPLAFKLILFNKNIRYDQT